MGANDVPGAQCRCWTPFPDGTMTVGRRRNGVVVTASSSRRRVARDDHQRHRAAVAVARPAAAAREANEGIPPAAGE
jgi:hypothetical protein